MGPLAGIRIIEFGGVGPAPFCGMLLADLGAEVIRIDRKSSGARIEGDTSGTKFDVLARGKRSIAVDLKKPATIDLCLRLVERSDATIEGFRPGVMERLGLGPEHCLARNPKLVYGRITGWGQDGPLAKTAGHDLNYIALSGALAAIGGPGQKPIAPLNLVGDFGGGGIYLALGILAALLEARQSGKGQVIDAAMVDGAASLMAMIFGFRAAGSWTSERGTNVLDGGASFYDTYETSDHRYVAIAPVEPQFYALLREKLGLTDPIFDKQMSREHWPEQRRRLAALFRTKTRAEWQALLEGTEACFAPVLDLDEVQSHPHNQFRRTMVEIEGVSQPNTAPRFSRTAAEIRRSPPQIGADTHAVLSELGLSRGDIQHLADQGAV